MEWLDAVLLGAVQGITEFLPISSTGHLVLVHDFLGTDGINELAFDAVLHFATTVAVMVYFWEDIWRLLQAVLRKLGRLPVNEADLTMVYALVVGTIPAVVLGVALEDLIDTHFRTTPIVAGVLFLASFFFMYTEWRYFLMPRSGDLTVRRAWLIGLFQALALVPGFSRSGATIAGGMLLGMSRYDASRFSFLLAIPITLGVGAKMLIELIDDMGAVDWVPVIIGSGVAFVTALVVIHFFLVFIRTYTLWPFVWYGIALAALVGYVGLFT